MTELVDVDATVKRIESLLGELQTAAGSTADAAEELVRLLMELYGAGLRRILEILGREPEAGLLDRLGDDKLVGSLLLLHGLHPLDTATRVGRALASLDRKLEGQRLVLAEIAEGVARIRVEAAGAAALRPGLQAAIERAVADWAPDLEAVVIEGIPQPASSLVQIAPAGAR